MNNYQCLVIGISRYQFFKPLNYGEADAQATYQFFIEQADIPEQRVVLISDTSPSWKSDSTYPNQDNLWKWFDLITQEISSTEIYPLWIFFNGYGLNDRGEDYLIPIDGNPKDISNTGISVLKLLNTLQQTRRPILLFLNLYHSDSLIKVGQQIMTLAQQPNIALIISLCCENEIITRSRTSPFIAALLEALNYYHHDITLAKLEQYFSDRLSSSTVATPIIISPSLAFSSQSLFTGTQKQKIKATASAPEHLKYLNLSTFPSTSVATTHLEDNLKPIAQNNVTTPSPSVPVEEGLAMKEVPLSSHWYKNQDNRFSLGKIYVLIGLIFLISLVSLFWYKSSWKHSFTHSTADIDAQRELLNQATNYLTQNQASGFNQAISKVRQIPLSSPIYPEAQDKITRWSQMILEIAQGRAKQGNFKDAIAAAQLVPAEQEQVRALAVEAINTWQMQAKQYQVNQALISGAKALINPISASSYNQGITILRQIPSHEPSYQEAQQLIEQWSQTIYKLAHSRAAKGNYQQAIATALLVPAETSAYERASEAIVQWKSKFK